MLQVWFGAHLTQKVGGMEALDGPYFETSFAAMLRKHAGWLVILFLGEMLTAAAMSHCERQIEESVAFAPFGANQRK